MEKQKEEQLAQRRADNIFSVNSFDLKIPKDYEKIIKIVFGGRTSAIAVQLSGKRGCALYRWIRAASGDNIVKFKFSAILNIFVDPSGHHILVSAENKVYYVHSSFSEGKEFHLRNFPQDTSLTAVAWNTHYGTENITKSILLGCRDGRILETMLESRIKSTKAFRFKSVCPLPHDQQIYGIHFEPMPDKQHLTGDQKQYYVLVATNQGFYQFVGGPGVGNIFLGDEEGSRNPGHNISVPHTKQNKSELRVYSKFAKERGASNHFTLLTEDGGIIHGTLAFRGQSGSNMVASHKSVKFPNDEPGVSVVETEFHFLVLQQDGLMVQSKLNNKIVFEEKNRLREETMLGLVTNVQWGMIFYYSDQRVFTVNIKREARDVWKLFLEKNDFQSALKYCKDNPKQRDQVITERAKTFMRRKEYTKAAIDFARSESMSFEEIALMFVEKKCQDALQRFLMEKLMMLSRSSAPRAVDANAGFTAQQKTMLATWLTEIMLDRMNKLQDKPQELAKMEKEFEHFVRKFQSCVNKNTTMKLITSHGRVKQLLFYAQLIKDNETVLGYHVRVGDFDTAIDCLSNLLQIPSDTIVELCYRHSPLLMRKSPARTVQMWKSSAVLRPWKLIPAMVRHNQDFQQHRKRGEVLRDYKGNDVPSDQAIKYLQYQIQECNNVNPTIHNCLLSFYAETGGENLLGFIHDSTSKFDLNYALRLCKRKRLNRACIHLLSALHLYEEAVDLSLREVTDGRGDYKLAKENADKPKDEEKKKKLWLRIAKHMLRSKSSNRRDGKGVIKQVMDMLRHCPLSIEDVLPDFPDEVQINEFKTEICDSLEKYNKEINTLKHKMEAYAATAASIRSSIKVLRRRHTDVAASQSCELCGTNIFRKEFYVFPCHHVFKVDCLIKEVMRHLTVAEQAKVNQLQASIASRKESDKRESSGDGPQKVEFEASNTLGEEQLKMQQKLDDIVAKQCPLCGDFMIESVATPFIAEDDPNANEWSIEKFPTEDHANR